MCDAKNRALCSQVDCSGEMYTPFKLNCCITIKTHLWQTNKQTSAAKRKSPFATMIGSWHVCSIVFARNPSAVASQSASRFVIMWRKHGLSKNLCTLNCLSTVGVIFNAASRFDLINRSRFDAAALNQLSSKEKFCFWRVLPTTRFAAPRA